MQSFFETHNEGFSYVYRYAVASTERNILLLQAASRCNYIKLTLNI